ncbi:hypothetical protein [Emticicia sp. BO119]|uniref:hypothetical protein n=1 Tax=Emticicia sp. BO119 TaxID=2757768 RepID=UPI0015EFE459|nr:hypothetical protein [Emticicia sp. BO119]MBA4853108.1 hypothetical protein [Emticicia sp. BO119]
MKKLMLFGTALLSIYLTACNKDTLSPLDSQSISAAENAITDGLRGQAPGDSTQKRPQLTNVDLGNLSATITDYINKTYAGAILKKAGKDKEGNFHVVIEKDEKSIGLLFNSDGTFNKELPPPPQQGMQQDGEGMAAPPQLTEVDIATLPATITDYINKTYAGATLKKAGKDKEGNYYVLIEKDSKPLGLLFDATGIFQKELPPPPKKGKK